MKKSESGIFIYVFYQKRKKRRFFDNLCQMVFIHFLYESERGLTPLFPEPGSEEEVI